MLSTSVDAAVMRTVVDTMQNPWKQNQIIFKSSRLGDGAVKIACLYAVVYLNEIDQALFCMVLCAN